jgi:cytochrome P450
MSICDVLLIPTLFSSRSGAVARSLRRDCPQALADRHVHRETTRETTVCDVALPTGTSLGVVIGAANRDTAHFGPTADAFDIFRPKKPPIAFGSGVHLCAGHWAARTSIGQLAVPLAYERFPGLRVDERRSEARDGWVFRGLTSLPVTWN